MKESLQSNSRVFRFLLGGACAVLILMGMRLASSILNLIFLGVLVAQSLSPLLYWLMRKGFSRGIALFATILIVLFGGLLLFGVLGSSLSRMKTKTPVYQVRITAMTDKAESFLRERDIPTTAVLSVEAIGPKRVVGFAGQLAGRASQAVGNLFLVLIIAIFLLLELAALREKSMRGGLPENSFLARFEAYTKDTGKYLAITGWIGLVTAAVDLVILLALGVDFAVVWAVLTFLLNYIPAVGNLLALLPPAILGLLESGWPTFFAVVIGYVVVNFIMDNIIKPRLVKQGLDLPPILLVISLVVWTWILGPIGAILAIPLTMTLKRFLQNPPGQASAQAEGSAGTK